MDNNLEIHFKRWNLSMGYPEIGTIGKNRKGLTGKITKVLPLKKGMTSNFDQYVKIGRTTVLMENLFIKV